MKSHRPGKPKRKSEIRTRIRNKFEAQNMKTLTTENTEHELISSRALCASVVNASRIFGLYFDFDL